MAFCRDRNLLTAVTTKKVSWMSFPEAEFPPGGIIGEAVHCGGAGTAAQPPAGAWTHAALAVPPSALEIREAEICDSDGR